MFDHWNGTDSPLIIIDHHWSSIDHHWSPIFLEHLGTLSISFHLLSWNFGRSPVSWALSPSFFDVATLQRVSRATYLAAQLSPQLSWFSDQRYCETCWWLQIPSQCCQWLEFSNVEESKGQQRSRIRFIRSCEGNPCRLWPFLHIYGGIWWRSIRCNGSRSQCLHIWRIGSLHINVHWCANIENLQGASNCGGCLILFCFLFSSVHEDMMEVCTRHLVTWCCSDVGNIRKVDWEIQSIDDADGEEQTATAPWIKVSWEGVLCGIGRLFNLVLPENGLGTTMKKACSVVGN